MAAPRLVMVAGPNGSGKSTLIEALRAVPAIRLPERYINADDIQRAQGLDSAAAQRAAAELRAGALAQKADFMYETVMSHPGKLAELQHARSIGYEIAIHFVATGDPSINVERVALRVRAGGHDVPEDRIRQRHGRTLALIPAALGLADQALVFDNSQRGNDGGLQLQAELVGTRLELTGDQPARWVEQLAASVNERADEFTRMSSAARGLGLAIAPARLDSSSSEGRIQMCGQHYAAQRGPQAATLVLHDRSLLPAPVARGLALRIDYREGVATVQALAPARQRTRLAPAKRGSGT